MSLPAMRAGQRWSQGVLQATTLPDGAFKLYVWLRLNARFDTGSLDVSRQELARALGRARSTIRGHLRRTRAGRHLPDDLLRQSPRPGAHRDHRRLLAL